jgi:hypothetical protein
MAMVTPRTVNLGLQFAAIKKALPEAQGRVLKGELHCDVVLQPTPASRRYTARLTYRHGRAPRVAIIDPPLTLPPGATQLPHVYSSGDLCLYLPRQWKESMLLADTILPWTSQWLLYYELWLITGHWLGTGHDYPVTGSPGKPKQDSNPRPTACP